MPFAFEKLLVYQKAITFADAVLILPPLSNAHWRHNGDPPSPRPLGKF
ncbi:MAG: hypothetical protein ABSB74_19640 [Tepidisphaeraceae bacterium]